MAVANRMPNPSDRAIGIINRAWREVSKIIGDSPPKVGIVPEVVVVVEKGLSFGTVLLTKTIQYYRNSSHAEHYNVGCPQCGIRKGIFFG